ncbi:AEC family transporter [Pseudomonas jilinensis]|uniref:AEC family transporter n=1 Tax=Pseudomonas jilinensis TaxID=2078689 RepID=A0A396RYE1_9PSED|nr:AEC family transporter [Pseudomonas jilinensis]RHW21489.1 AEC family transporter [Pseudomonas jilinensis]
MSVVDALIPIFALIAIGYLLGWRRWLPTEAGTALAAITFKLFMPVLLFAGLARADLSEGLSPMLLVAYFVPALLVFILINVVAHRSQGRPTSMGLAASYSNNVLVGIPLVSLLLGTDKLVYLFAVLVFHSLILFTLQSLYIALFSGHGERLSWRQTLSSLTNPIIVGLLLGATLNLSGLALPAAVWRTVDWLAAASLLCALLVLGMSLAHYRLYLSRAMLSLTLAKLLAFPLLVMGFTSLLPLNPEARTVLILMAACPTGVNVLAYAMGQEDNRIISSVIFLSTLLAAFSMPLWLLLLS